MYATLAQFCRMPKEQQAKVTHLDLAIADDSDEWRGGNAFATPEESLLEQQERELIYGKRSR